MPVKLSSTGGGSVTLTTPSTASDFTVTFPANTGNVVTTGSSAVVTQAMLGTNVAGNGPAFSAYLSADQTITSSTFTKVQLNAELFDTNSNFDTCLRLTAPLQHDAFLFFTKTGVLIHMEVTIQQRLV